jgi:FkbM family methyltransferase
MAPLRALSSSSILEPVSRARMPLSTSQKLFIAKTANRGISLVRRLAGRPMQGEFERSGVRWHLDLNEGIDFAIYLLGAFEPDLLRYYTPHLRAGDVIVDIGANVGAHTLHFARLVGGTGKVIAIEPTNFALGKLKRNIALNPALVPIVDVEQMFLAAAESQGAAPEISSSWPLVGDTDDPLLVGARLHSTTGARTTSLDALVREKGLARVDWVKLDVDGHELDVLKGSTDVLKRLRPRILMELAPYCHPGTGFEELVAILSGSGYTFRNVPDEKVLAPDPAALRAAIPARGGINVLAVPE